MHLNNSSARRLFFLFSTLTSIEAVGALFWLSIIPADTSNAVWLGYSIYRLLLMALPLLLILSLAVLLLSKGYRTDNFIKYTQDRSLLRLSICGGAVLTLFLLFAPSMKNWQAVIVRLLPVGFLCCLLLIQWPAMVYLTSKASWQKLFDWYGHTLKNYGKSIVFIFSLFSILYILSIVTYPYADKNDFWWETGIPILLWQVIICLLVALILSHYEERLQQLLLGKLDTFFFVTIIICVGVFWTVTPMQSSFFNTDSYPPNYQSYPSSDSAIFDLQAQSVLLGKGINSGRVLDRPFYPIFLTILHVFCGQSLASNMALQAFIYAALPGLVYMICAESGSRMWGIFSSLVTGFWGLNAINASNILNTSAPKQILTEYPLAIILAVIILLTVRWIKSGMTGYFYPTLIGAIISLSAFIRYSGLSLLPTLMLLVIFKHRRSVKKAFPGLVLLIVSFIVFSAPWHIRNLMTGKWLVIPYISKLNFVIDTRISNTNKNSDLNSPWIDKEGEELLDEKTNYSEKQWDAGNSAEGDSLTFSSSVAKIFPHFIHNVMSSLLILPVSLQMGDIKYSIRMGGEIWKYDWAGILSLPQLIVFACQMLIFSLGIAVMYKKTKELAIVTLLIFLGITVSNSLGISSGGRFIVPVNWIVLVIYTAGIAHIISKLNFMSSNKDTKLFDICSGETSKPSYWMWVLLGIGLVGAMPVFIDRLSIVLKPATNRPIGLIEELETREDGINSIILVEGYVFYPRIQSVSSLQLSDEIRNAIKKKTITTFMLLQDHESVTAYFPFNKKIEITNQDRIYATGCIKSEDFYIQELIITHQNTSTHYVGDNIGSICQLPE